jgi:hypothetical protein
VFESRRGHQVFSGYAVHLRTSRLRCKSESARVVNSDISRYTKGVEPESVRSILVLKTLETPAIRAFSLFFGNRCRRILQVSSSPTACHSPAALDGPVAAACHLLDVMGCSNVETSVSATARATCSAAWSRVSSVEPGVFVAAKRIARSDCELAQGHDADRRGNPLKLP